MLSRLRISRFFILNQINRKISSENDLEIENDDVKSVINNFSSELAGDNRVFILQPKMQYKAKARQSMNPQIQLDEAIGLIKTLNNWKIIDTHVISTKNANKKAIWGSGNIEMLSKKSVIIFL